MKNLPSKALVGIGSVVSPSYSLQVDAVVYDAPVLQHYASHEGSGQVKVVGVVFQAQNYGITLPVGSPYREDINLALLRLMERGEYQELYSKWFGGEEVSQ